MLEIQETRSVQRSIITCIVGDASWYTCPTVEHYPEYSFLLLDDLATYGGSKAIELPVDVIQVRVESVLE